LIVLRVSPETRYKRLTKLRGDIPERAQERLERGAIRWEEPDLPDDIHVLEFPNETEDDYRIIQEVLREVFL